MSLIQTQALRAVTIEAAYSWRKEGQIGSIAPGKIANFTVLEQDPYKVNPKTLKDVPIWGTVFEGRLFPIPASAQKAALATDPVQPVYAQKLAHRHALPSELTHDDAACGLAELSQAVVAAYTDNLRAQRQ
jgi:adenine deaminase